MEDINDETVVKQTESVSFALSRMCRLESLLQHMKRGAPAVAIVDLDAALDYTREAISELN